MREMNIVQPSVATNLRWSPIVFSLPVLCYKLSFVFRYVCNMLIYWFVVICFAVKMSALHCDSSCTRYVCMKISTSPTQFTVWYSSKHNKLQLPSRGAGTLEGSLGCFLFHLQKVYFIVYEQNDEKLKYMIIPLTFATFCENVHKMYVP